METDGAGEVLISGGDEAECSETTVEIMIKTLDSQIHTLRVNKRMPVPALKDRIATLTGILSEQQRLICRGKVLKDDQLLSAYHVEDGHTLHLVVRQPLHTSPSSTGGLMGSERVPDHPGPDPTSGTARSRGNPVAHSVLLGTFNIADQGDGVMPDLNRIVSAILNSVGIGNIGSGGEGLDLRGSGLERHDRTVASRAMSDSTQLQPEQAPRGQFDPLHGAFRFPTPVSLGSLLPQAIPDSLTTLSQYLSHMRHEFNTNSRVHSSNVQAGDTHGDETRDYDSASQSGAQGGLPTPASLAEVMLSTRQLLIEQAGGCLSQLARQLQQQGSVTDPVARVSIQSSAMRSGVLLSNLGALLLELGRATMTLRVGRNVSEAVVNAGPAVFISTSGPNPMMVQPLPFQPGTNFGAIPMGAVHPSHGLAGGALGSGFLPRNIDIRIRTGPTTSTANADLGEHDGTQQPSDQADTTRITSGTNSVHEAASGVSVAPISRSVPVRTVIAAVPAAASRPPSDSSGSAVGVFYPLLARFQHLDPVHMNDSRGSQASSEHRPETSRQPQSAGQQENLGSISGTVINESNSQTTNLFSTNTSSLFSVMNSSANAGAQNQQGPLLATNSSQQEQSDTVSGSENATNNNTTPASEGQWGGQGTLPQIPCRVDQLLRTIFSGEQIHLNDTNFQGMSIGSVAEQTETRRDSEVDESPRTGINQGIFFSGLVRQMMPFISPTLAMEPTQDSPVIPAMSDTAELSSMEVNGEGQQNADTTSPESSIPRSERENSGEVRATRPRDEPPSPSHSKRQKSE